MTPQEGERDPRPLLARLPLRLRITGWVLAMFAVIHVTLSVVVVLYNRDAVRRAVRADLRGAAEARLVRGPDEPEAPIDRVLHHAHAARWGPLLMIELDGSGTIVDTAGPWGDDAFQRLAAEAIAKASETLPVTFRDADDEFVLALVDVEPEGTLLIGASRAEVRRAMQPVTTVLLLTLPIGLLATGIAAWTISGVAIRPIEQVRQFAEELSAETVTEAIELDEAAPELESLRRELEAAMERIGEGYDQQARFLANVSHELKTPISVVRTEAEVLMSADPDRDELLRFASSAAEEMERLGRMIESFLLLTRVRQGAARLRLEPVPANDVLMAAFEACVGMAEQHGVSIAPRLCEDENQPEIRGNEDLLSTAIANLIRNAIRFTPRDQTVHTACQTDGESVVFSVADLGPGVPEELIGRLFEPFTQSDEERRRGRGTGLGLQITQAIAELHGGAVAVENTRPGCRFRLSLPVAGPDGQSPE